MNNSKIQNEKLESELKDDIDQIGSLSLLKNGFNFHFNVEGHDIHAWGSQFSGKEKVFVDGKTVSNKWGITRKSVHSFTLNGAIYELEFNMVSILTGELHCILIKDGVHVETQKQVSKLTVNKKFLITLIGIGLLGGFAIGVFFVKSISSIIFN